jgi:hypothetical protein
VSKRSRRPAAPAPGTNLSARRLRPFGNS